MASTNDYWRRRLIPRVTTAAAAAVPKDAEFSHENEVALIGSLPANLLMTEILNRLPLRTRSVCRCVCKLWELYLRVDLVLIGILSRLPVKSLLRFRSVARLWLSIIDDPHFAQVHYLVSSRTTHELLLWDNGLRWFYTVDNAKNEFSPKIRLPPLCGDDILESMNVVQSCNGLILMAGFSGGIRICNPSTRMFLDLPPVSIEMQEDLPGDNSYFGLGFDRASNKHKVVHMEFIPSDSGMFDIEDSKCNLECEVFTLGEGLSSSWRRIGLVPFPLLGTCHPVYADGVIYWRNFHDGSTDFLFAAFLVTEELFQLVGHPSGIDTYMFPMGLVSGHLFVATVFIDDCDRRFFRTWLLQDPSSNIWIEDCAILPFDVQLCTGPMGIFNEEIMVPTYEGLLCHNLKTRSFRIIFLSGHPSVPGVTYFITDYAESITRL